MTYLDTENHGIMEPLRRAAAGGICTRCGGLTSALIFCGGLEICRYCATLYSDSPKTEHGIFHITKVVWLDTEAMGKGPGMDTWFPMPGRPNPPYSSAEIEWHPDTHEARAKCAHCQKVKP